MCNPPTPHSLHPPLVSRLKGGVGFWREQGGKGHFDVTIKTHSRPVEIDERDRSQIDPGGEAKEGGDAFSPLLCNIQRIMMLYHKQEVAGE